MEYALGQIRTDNFRLRRSNFYPIELRALIFFNMFVCWLMQLHDRQTLIIDFDLVLIRLVL